jgi:hypothetical protein
LVISHDFAVAPDGCTSGTYNAHQTLPHAVRGT